MRRFWTDEMRAELRDLAATGMPSSEIGAKMGTTKLAVITAAYHSGVTVVLHTEAELAVMRARARIREKRKRDKRRKPRPLSSQSIVNRTHPVYRNQLPRLPEMTKNELRAMLTEAVRNTAEMIA